MRERKKGKTQEQAAVAANLSSRKTVAKYEQIGQLPSQLKQPRTYRTREDPFAQDWPTLEAMLDKAPELEAKTLFEWLCEQHPDRYHQGQLRTLQRRIRQWRALNKSQTATLDQIREPGDMMQVDGTSMNELGITIQGVPFKHLLIHCVLPYSNWSWGRVTQSESFNALQLGVQSSLVELGHTPKVIQTDNSTAVTQVGKGGTKERRFTDQWLHLCEHYGVKPNATHVGSPNENGDVEAANGVLKRSVKQALLMRGSREFERIEAYELFLFDVMRQRNKGREPQLSEELAQMTPLQATRLSGKVVTTTVNSASMIRVLNRGYSVPTSLIGHKVKVHIREWTLEVYLGSVFVESLPRVVGSAKHVVNYRHVTPSLLRKPGGFRKYRYREALFPRHVFRQAWEQLDQWHASHKADLTYLRILHLAATGLEEDVALALEELLGEKGHWDETTVEGLVKAKATTTQRLPRMAPFEVDLTALDALLGVAI